MARMPLETVRLTAVLPASADRIYAAWLDSVEHSRMTGSKAVVDAGVGGEHSAWDGYVEGRILELEPGRRIVQSWRSSDFPLDAGDSRLEVHLLDVPGGCEVTIIHTQIPEGQGAQYEGGWRDHYFEPMRKYFGKPKGKAKPKPKKAAKPKKKAAPQRSKKPAKKKKAVKPKAERRRR